MKYGIIKDQFGNPHKFAKVILGAFPFGSIISEELSFQAMDYYRGQGGNVIDTARVYCDFIENGSGASEKTVGKWIKERNCRNEFYIISKGSHPAISNMQKSRLSPEEISYDLGESLKALEMDCIDLYFLHRDDEKIPVKNIMDSLHGHVAAGRIKMLGASNWRIERILEANEYAIANGKTPFVVSEIQWSYAYCSKEIFGDSTVVCMDGQQHQQYLKAGIPVLAFTSQAGGLFSAGYQQDLSDIAPKHKKYHCEENVKRYQKLLETCAAKGITPTRACLEYIIDNEVNGFAIVGCTKLEQLQDSLKGI
ncbi:MAG TPA: aldo/keto reductase [Clostridiales bacterium]|nr:aldo/keto reductase [Clostridiales bacterium]